MVAGAINTHFLFNATPNSAIPDCGMDALGGAGVFAARSYHPGGVNAVMVDGSARWHSSKIDLRTWRALGTRSAYDIEN